VVVAVVMEKAPAVIVAAASPLVMQAFALLAKRALKNGKIEPTMTNTCSVKE